MAVNEGIAGLHAEMTRWRRDIHAHPELGFEETRTSDLVAGLLAQFGFDEVHRGVGRTGVVGTLRAGRGTQAIGLRADMDALPIREANAFEHRSRHNGRMHACGHDGHTAMLLGAAKYLAATRRFDGVVHFIFQPAEEGLGGAQAMLAEGLFERFNVERDPPLIMASEDFSFMLEQVPGCYLNVGSGMGEGSCEVHNPGYDFNDAALPFGASFFARLIEARLARR